MATNVVIIESANGGLAALVRGAGMTVRVVDPQIGLSALEQTSTPPDVLVLDLRMSASVPSELATFKRRHPRTGVVIAVPAFDPKIMLEAMRAQPSIACSDRTRRKLSRAKFSRFSAPRAGSAPARWR